MGLLLRHCHFKMASLTRGISLARSATRLRAAGRPLMRYEIENSPGMVRKKMYSFIYCSFIKKGEIGYIVSTPVCKVEQLSTRYRMCNDKNQVYKCAAFYGQVFNFSSIRLR